MSDKNEPNLPRIPRRSNVTRHANLLFGSVEDLLADLIERGAPDGGVVRIERVVRNTMRRTSGMGGTAILGIAVTARREDEVLSCWVVVGQLSLDPFGQPTDRTRASALTARHHEAQRIIGALFADAGFDVHLGLYRLPDDCYRFTATCAALDQQAAAAQAQPGTDQTDQPRPSGLDRPSTAEDLTSPDDPNGEHTSRHQDGEADDVH